jgi:hypothetical protein
MNFSLSEPVVLKLMVIANVLFLGLWITLIVVNTNTAIVPLLGVPVSIIGIATGAMRLKELNS